MMEPSDLRKLHAPSHLWRVNLSKKRSILAKRQVGSGPQVQVDNITPIILSAEKSVTRGTRGMAVLFGFMKLWLRMGKEYFGAAGKRTMAFVSSCRNGCSIRSFVVERARPRFPSSVRKPCGI